MNNNVECVQYVYIVFQGNLLIKWTPSRIKICGDNSSGKPGERLGETEDGNVRQKSLFPNEAQPTKFFFLRLMPILVRTFYNIWGLLCRADETMISESQPTLIGS